MFNEQLEDENAALSARLAAALDRERTQLQRWAQCRAEFSTAVEMVEEVMNTPFLSLCTCNCGTADQTQTAGRLLFKSDPLGLGWLVGGSGFWVWVSAIFLGFLGNGLIFFGGSLPPPPPGVPAPGTPG